MSHSAPGFDARALTEPVDLARLRQFAQWMRTTYPGSGSANTGQIIAFVVVGMFALGGFIFVIPIFGMIVGSLAGRGGAIAGLIVSLLIAAGLIAGVIALVVVNVTKARARREEARYRISRFATANGLTYLPTYPNPPLPGMIFGLGSARAANDLVRGEHPRFVEFANYQYTTSSDNSSTTHRWGYVAIRLDVPLPHIVLDATNNNGLIGSNLPVSFSRFQRLSLEGDFDRYFTLHCPEGYERDALYLFTPDIMVRFMDHAAAMDVEIVDDWLFLYAHRDFSTADPATWAWLFSVVGALLDKLGQWARWRDERLAAYAAAIAAQSSMTPAPHPQPTAPGMIGPTPVPGGPPPAPGVAAPAHAVPAHGGAGSAPFGVPPELLRPPPGVAPPGRRLRRTRLWLWFAIGIPAAWIAFQAIGYIVFWFTR